MSYSEEIFWSCLCPGSSFHDWLGCANLSLAVMRPEERGTSLFLGEFLLCLTLSITTNSYFGTNSKLAQLGQRKYLFCIKQTISSFLLFIYLFAQIISSEQNGWFWERQFISLKSLYNMTPEILIHAAFKTLHWILCFWGLFFSDIKGSCDNNVFAI